MMTKALAIAILAALSVAAPVAQPENFEVEPLLNIGGDKAKSSYAQKRES